MKKWPRPFLIAALLPLSGCMAFQQVVSLVEEGRYEEANLLGEKAVAEINAPRAHIVARAYAKKGQIDQARKWYERCFTRATDGDLAPVSSYFCALEIARLDSEGGNIDGAITNYKRARDLAKSMVGVRNSGMRESDVAAVQVELDAALEEQKRRRPPIVASTPAAPTMSASLDLAFWDSIKTSNNPSDFLAYLQRFPQGTFAELARVRLTSFGEAPLRLSPLGLPPSGTINFGRYHALVIGIDNYRQVTRLKTAVNDAQTVAEILSRDYGFEVKLMIDATRNQMLDAFDDLRRALTDNDNLLIYYAGHGHLDTDSDRGFWLPVDAHKDRRSNWLSNADIADVVRGTRAKHVLVVADSCYAGTLTRNLSVQLTGLDDFSRLAQKRARTALVSGGLEPVEDAGGGSHSVFAKAFLDQLRANTGVVDMSQIFSAMRRQVLLSAQQTPQYGDIRQTGHEGGDFIFVRRTGR